MLQDIHSMTAYEIYHARYEIAGLITQTRGLITYLENDIETRARGSMLRRECDLAESALLAVIRP